MLMVLIGSGIEELIGRKGKNGIYLGDWAGHNSECIIEYEICILHRHTIKWPNST